MSEDYKKIALEDVKKGQWIRIVERHPSLTITYEGAVLKTMIDLGRIDLGEEVGDYVTIIVDPEPEPGIDFDIFLLEDAPTDTVTFGNDGVAKLGLTMTVLPSGSVTVESDKGESYTFLSDTRHGGATYFEDTGILRFASKEHRERHEERCRGKMLKDSLGDVWAYINGKWRYWCGEGDGHWCDGATIGDYAEDGFVIVDGLG